MTGRPGRQQERCVSMPGRRRVMQTGGPWGYEDFASVTVVLSICGFSPGRSSTVILHPRCLDGPGIWEMSDKMFFVR